MSDWKKSLLPAVVIVGAVAAFVFGNESRARLDTGRTVKSVPQPFLAGIESPSDSKKVVPEGELFYQLLLLLERDYVDPNVDQNETKLAYGAVKGMLAGLWDPLSEYFPKDHFEDYKRRLTGVFHGAGVELRAVTDPVEIKKVRKNSRSADPYLLSPILEVATVVPGGPADHLGIKVGDRISAVNGKWLLGYTDVKKIREMQRDLGAGKITADQYKVFRAEFQKRAKSSITVARAEDLLILGEGKTFDVTWARANAESSGTLSTAETKLPAVQTLPDGTISLRVMRGASEQLSQLNLGSGNITLDLRQSSLGDSTEIKPILQLLSPAGKFGQIVSERPGEPRTLVTEKGTTVRRHYRLIVDRSTRGATELLALALKARGLADTVGGPMAGEPAWIETDALGDGSGYMLNTGRFESDTVEARK